MRRASAAIVLAVALGPAAGIAAAQAVQNVVLRNSFNPVGAGARGLGMGGAFIAVADDGTAASFNPAGLAQLRRSELALVGFADQLRSTILIPKAEGSDTRSDTSRHGAPDFAGLAIPFEVGGRNLTIQASYQRAVDLFGKGRATILQVFDLSDVDPSLRGNGEIIADVAPDQSGAFHTASLSAGYELTSRLSIGASINYWIAEWTSRGTSDFRLRLRVPGSPRPLELPLFETDFAQDQSLRGLNVNAGFLLRYPKLSVGGVVRLPFTGDYTLFERDTERLFEFMGRPGGTRRREIRVRSRLHWPQSAGAGIALRPIKGLTLAGDYSRTHWSRTFIEDVPGGALLTEEGFDAEGVPVETFIDRNFFDLLPASRTVTNDTDQWRGGAEYLLVLPKLVIPFRAGIFRDRSPVVDLGTGEGRRIEGFTVGTGLNFDRVVLDLAFERRTSEGQISLRLRGGEPVLQTGGVPTESVRETRVVASVIYRFGDNDPLKRALHFLFVGPSEEEEGP